MQTADQHGSTGETIAFCDWALTPFITLMESTFGQCRGRIRMAQRFIIFRLKERIFPYQS